MTWTAPMTAVANSAFTAAQFNQYVRDNLNETAPAKVSGAGQYVVADSANHVVARQAAVNRVETGESTSSTAFTDLATFGPIVTVTTGTTVIVFVHSYMQNATAGQVCLVGFDIDGATTVAASDTYTIRHTSTTAVAGSAFSGCFMLTGLTSGSNVFTAKYRVLGGTGLFVNRSITVVPY